MNRREAAIISAYTGVCLGKGDIAREFHKYVEEKFGRSVYTHEMASSNFWEELKKLSKPDLINLSENITE